MYICLSIKLTLIELHSIVIHKSWENNKFVLRIYCFFLYLTSQLVQQRRVRLWSRRSEVAHIESVKFQISWRCCQRLATAATFFWKELSCCPGALMRIWAKQTRYTLWFYMIWFNLCTSARCISDHPENIQDSIKDCHRAVVFLTDSYIKDDWSVMAMQKVSSQIKKLVIVHTCQILSLTLLYAGWGENDSLPSKF